MKKMVKRTHSSYGQNYNVLMNADKTHPEKFETEKEASAVLFRDFIRKDNEFATAGRIIKYSGKYIIIVDPEYLPL